MKILLAVNPISGGEKGKSFIKKATQFFQFYSIPFAIYETTGQRDEEKLTALIEDEKPTKIGAGGGDGTVLMVAKTLLKKDIPLGIIPLGSANGMATELGVKTDPMAALKDLVLSQQFVPLDLLQINQEHLAIHLGDVGINAHLVHNYEQDENRGMTTYAKYFVQALQEVEPFSFTVAANGKEEKYTGKMLGICNARKFGTGIPLNTVSNPGDGKFELVVIENLDAKMLISAGLSKFDEAFAQGENMQLIQSKEATVTFEKPQLLQLDGEVIGKQEKIDIKMLAGAVRFISTGDNPYAKN